jgi:hypothetical protein
VYARRGAQNAESLLGYSNKFYIRLTSNNVRQHGFGFSLISMDTTKMKYLRNIGIHECF